MLTISHRDETSLRIAADSEEDTREFGRRLAQVLNPGAVVALVGDLGAGKTRLVQAIAAALDVPADEVNSPTFTLVQEYAGRMPLRHCDTYRLKHPDEFLDLGLDELFAADGIAFVEWADRVAHLLPRDILRIEIRLVSEAARLFEVLATGTTSHAMLDRLGTLIASNTPHDSD